MEVQDYNLKNKGKEREIHYPKKMSCVSSLDLVLKIISYKNEQVKKKVLKNGYILFDSKQIQEDEQGAKQSC